MVVKTDVHNISLLSTNLRLTWKVIEIEQDFSKNQLMHKIVNNAKAKRHFHPDMVDNSYDFEWKDWQTNCSFRFCVQNTLSFGRHGTSALKHASGPILYRFPKTMNQNYTQTPYGRFVSIYIVVMLPLVSKNIPNLHDTCAIISQKETQNS